MTKLIYRLIKALLKFFLKSSQKKVKSSFNRSLSFGDYISDRWDKASSLGFGEGSSIYDNVLVLGNVSVGKNTWIGPNCILDGSGGELIIGDNCSIAAGVHIYTHNSVERSTSGGLEELKTESTFIGDNCYIGPNAIIAMGTILGKGCVVGGLTLVNGIKARPRSKIYGVPGKIIV